MEPQKVFRHWICRFIWYSKHAFNEFLEEYHQFHNKKIDSIKVWYKFWRKRFFRKKLFISKDFNIWLNTCADWMMTKKKSPDWNEKNFNSEFLVICLWTVFKNRIKRCECGTSRAVLCKLGDRWVCQGKITRGFNLAGFNLDFTSSTFYWILFENFQNIFVVKFLKKP